MSQHTDGADQPDPRESAESPGSTATRWSLDDLLTEPPPPLPPPVRRPIVVAHRPIYYVSSTVAVMLTLGLVAALVVLAVHPPAQRVAGSPRALAILPTSAPPTATTSDAATASTTTTASTATASTTTTPSTPPVEAYGELATHPLSVSPATVPPLTCPLPTFGTADAEQAAFYAAAAACASGVFDGLLTAAGLTPTPVELVVVQHGPVDTPCGPVEPAAPATQCAGTVYMTPIWLRDVEANGRYPGRYLGVFLREYARAVLDNTMAPLYQRAQRAGLDPADLALQVTRQATCLAGVAAGAMANRGSVDANLVAEIRDRLTSRDAPADAGVWFAEGFGSRQPAACDVWRVP